MPEGHITHRLALDLTELVGSALSVSSPQGKFPQSRTVNRKRLRSTQARGRHLFLHFDAATVHIQPGAQGKMFRVAPLRPPQLQVRLRLSSPDVAWDLIAPTVCELLSRDGAAELTKGLGPDPLDPDADPERVWEVLERYSGPIGAALLDQAVVAGVGSLTEAGALMDAGISPARSAFELSREEFDALWAALGARMHKAVEQDRTTPAKNTGGVTPAGRPGTSR